MKKHTDSLYIGSRTLGRIKRDNPTPADRDGVSWQDYVTYMEEAQSLAFTNVQNVYKDVEIIPRQGEKHIICGSAAGYIRQTAARALAITAMLDKQSKPFYIDYDCKKAQAPLKARFMNSPKSHLPSYQKLKQSIKSLSGQWKTMLQASAANNNPIFSGRFHNFFDNQGRLKKADGRPLLITLYNPRKQVAQLIAGANSDAGILIADGHTRSILDLGSTQHWGHNSPEKTREMLATTDRIIEQNMIHVRDDQNDRVPVLLRRSIDLAPYKAQLVDDSISLKSIMETIEGDMTPWPDVAQAVIDHDDMAVVGNMATSLMHKISIMHDNQQTMNNDDQPSLF